MWTTLSNILSCVCQLVELLQGSDRPCSVTWPACSDLQSSVIAGFSSPRHDGLWWEHSAAARCDDTLNVQKKGRLEVFSSLGQTASLSLGSVATLCHHTGAWRRSLPGWEEPQWEDRSNQKSAWPWDSSHKAFLLNKSVTADHTLCSNLSTWPTACRCFHHLKTT